jgi:hypothetical protein
LDWTLILAHNDIAWKHCISNLFCCEFIRIFIVVAYILLLYGCCSLFYKFPRRKWVVSALLPISFFSFRSWSIDVNYVYVAYILSFYVPFETNLVHVYVVRFQLSAKILINKDLVSQWPRLFQLRNCLILDSMIHHEITPFCFGCPMEVFGWRDEECSGFLA